ncbi:MAG: hypothetical protein A2096_08125 [Spirochaetes bacterium GWF1_41_5]|nr:MAG: hypothetical protein A2096_08125 [Spirochaetes bacterium GWF1_41_5]HBE04165.1 hypothetical protein [Spirochaetia bacterium]
MKKFVQISMLMLFAALAITACKQKGIRNLGGDQLVGREGWQNDDTFRMIVVGSWDRKLYYIEGKDAEEGKQSKSLIVLQQLSKRSAQVESARNFREKMGVYIKSKTGVEDSTLIGDVIQSSMEGITIMPAALEESYTPMGDVEVLFEFKSKGLKKVIDDAAKAVLAKSGKAGPGAGM